MTTNDEIIKKYGKTLSESNYKLDFEKLFAKTELNDALNEARVSERERIKTLLERVLSETDRYVFVDTNDEINGAKRVIEYVKKEMNEKLNEVSK